MTRRIKRRRGTLLLAPLLFLFSLAPAAFGSVVVRYVEMTVPELPSTEDYEQLIFFVDLDVVVRDDSLGLDHDGDFSLFASISAEQAGLWGEGNSDADASARFGYSRVEVGDTVGPGDGFTHNRPLFGASPNDWEPGDSGYLGVEFELDLDEDSATTDPHYGWLYLEVLEDSSVYIDSYAFETEPGVTIEVPEAGAVISGFLGLAVLATVTPIPSQQRRRRRSDTWPIPRRRA